MNILPMVSRLLISWLLLVSAFACAAPVLPADGNRLTLSEAIALSIQRQPLLQSLESAANASRASAIAEGQLPDPKVKLGVINLPATNRDAFRFDREAMTMTSIGFEQEMVPQAKRDAAAQYLQAEARQYEAEQLVSQRSIQRAVAIAWLEARTAQQQVALYRQLIATMQAERQAALLAASASGRPLSDLLKLDTQVSATQDRLLLAQGDERKARALLARWLGADAKRPLSDAPLSYMPPPSSPAIRQDVALEDNPRLMNARQQEALAQSDLERAQLARLSNWRWELGYGKRFAAASDMVSFQVAFDLQTDRAHRQDQRTAEKQLSLERARQLTEDRRLELAAELEAARADWEIAEAREQEHQQRLIPAAQARLKLQEAAYRAGQPNLTELWEAKRQVLEVQVAHLNVMTSLQRAAINMAYILNDEHFFTSQLTAGGQP